MDQDFLNKLSGGSAAPAPSDQGSAPSSGFSDAADFTMGHERGYNENDAGRGPTMHGINSAANPDVDVKNLTEDGARDIYKARYWDAIDGDRLNKISPVLAKVAFDTSINMGAPAARNMLRASGGDPAKLLQLREDKYRDLLAADPQKYGKYAQSWKNRIDDLRGMLGQGAGASGAGSWDRGSGMVDSAPPAPDATLMDYGKKGAASLIRGVGTLGQFAGEMGAYGMNKLTHSEDYEGFNPLDRPAAAIENTMTPGGKAKSADAFKGNILEPSTWEAPDTGGGLAMQVMDGLGNLGSFFVANTLTGGLSSMAKARNIARGLEEANAAVKAAQVAGDAAAAGKAAETAANLAKQYKSAERLVTAQQMALGGGMSFGDGANDAREFADKRVATLTHAQLMDVPVYREAFEKYGSEDQARKAVSNNAAMLGGILASGPGALGAKLSGKVFEDILAKKAAPALLGGEIKNRAARVGVEGGLVAMGEGIGEASEKMGSNAGANIATGQDWSQDIGRDTLAEAMGGVFGGGATGGFHAAISPHAQDAGHGAPPATSPVAPAAPSGPLGRAAGASNPIQAVTPSIDSGVAPVESSARSIIPDASTWNAIPQEDRTEVLRLAGLADHPSATPAVREHALDLARHIVGSYMAGSMESTAQPGGAALFGQSQPQSEQSQAQPSDSGAKAAPAAAPIDQPGAQTATENVAADASVAMPTAGISPESAAARRTVDAPAVEIPAGADIAAKRKRQAQLQEMVDRGFGVIDRDGAGQFWLVNPLRNEQLSLQNGLDAQMARKLIADHKTKGADIAAASPNNSKAEPTDAQIAAGNYAKGKYKLFGMNATVENPKGSTRSGTSPDGKAWSTTMSHDYGDISGIKGADGDNIDVFRGDKHGSNKVFVVDQVDPKTGLFDEHKVMADFGSEADARAAYLANYEPGWKGLGAITAMTPEQFVAWTKSGQTAKPVSSTIQVKHNGGEYGANTGEASAGLAEGAPSENQGAQPAVRGGRTAFLDEGGVARSERTGGASEVGRAEADGPAGTLAKTAPIGLIGRLRKSILALKGIDISVDQDPLTGKHRVASILANLLGKTYTVVQHESGPGREMPNGFVNRMGGDHIFVDKSSTEAPMLVVMHEAYHGLPEELRKELNESLLKLAKNEMRSEFARQFEYDANDSKLLDEEIPAFMAQAIASRPDFWDQLRSKMGEGDFIAVARYILKNLNDLLHGVDDAYGQGFIDKYITDVEKARDLLVDAYAQALKDHGKPADSLVADGLMSSNRARRKAEPLGDFEATTAKDGTMVVYGDASEIRTAIPDGIIGRAGKDGITFSNADAPRVRAALEGSKIAYSRGGQVVEKLPTRNGKYLGAPPKFNTPGKITSLRKWLRKLADEGAPGRYWYENSGREVLKMVGGDTQEARKFVALLAIYSPQAKVDANSTFALRAWAQYKAGQPISVKTGVMDAKAQNALDHVDEFWSGEKTGNFFFNLLREIDPTTEGKQGATIDMWMMRAGQYPTDNPTKTEYSFMENETNRLAADLGWEPQQVQAAIWVAMKARMENAGVKQATEASSEKKGWLQYTYPEKNGKPKKTRDILDAEKHRENWLKHAFAHDPSAQDTQQAKFDFGDGLKRHIGQISFEARPSTKVDVLPGIHNATYAQQVEFQQAVQAAFLDEHKGDELGKMLGLLIDDNDVITPGVWEGVVSPAQQKLVAMAPAKGDAGQTSVDPAQAKALNTYAAIAGLVTHQDAVGWHRPFYAAAKRVSNGLDIKIGRPITQGEAKALEGAIGEWMASNGRATFVNEDGKTVAWNHAFAIISAPAGVRLVTFGVVSNEEMQTAILDVAGTVLPESNADWFVSSGGMPSNDWKVNKNGQDYVAWASAQGRSDVLGWARDVLAPRVQRVFDEFSERYNWGNPGKISFSNRAVRPERSGDGSGRPSDWRDAGGEVRAPERGVQATAGSREKQRELTPLPGAPNVPGFHGPDPRLVSVAEQYAQSNGIDLRRQAEYVKVDVDRAQRIAQAYSDMEHAPNDPRVKAAYQNLIRQTVSQYEALKSAGYKFWFVDMKIPSNADYVSTPWNAMRDIRANKEMGVFPTDSGFGSNDEVKFHGNPLEQQTQYEWPVGGPDGPLKPVLANDLFRAVHDAFGHGLEGAGFRAQGEENAWQAHSRLFTGSALGAITSETRGQNSWLNFGPYGEHNQTANTENTHFADQKTGLMPSWTWREGVAGDYDDAAPAMSNRSDASAADRQAVPAGRQRKHVEFVRVIHPDGSTLVDAVRGADKSNAMDRARSAWPDADIHSISREEAESQDPGIGAAADKSMQPAYTHEVVDPRNGNKVMGRYQSMAAARRGRDRFDDKYGGYRYQARESGSDGPAFSNRAVAKDDLGFYSALSSQVANSSMNQAPASAWKAYIKALTQKGVKPDEIAWTGVNDWLDLQDGKVPKQALQAFLDSRGVQLQETTLGGNESEPKHAYVERIVEEKRAQFERDRDDKIQTEMERFDHPYYVNEEVDEDGVKTWEVRSDYGVVSTHETEEEAQESSQSYNDDAYDEYERDVQRNADEFDEDDATADAERDWSYEQGDDATKYEDYTLPGGNAYREVLLTLPEPRDRMNAAMEAEAKAREAYRTALRLDASEDELSRLRTELARAARDFEDANSAMYKSSHWDERNVLAHMRLNDRIDSDGNRILFVEEIQSDWAQDLRKARESIGQSVDDNFERIVQRMKDAGVLQVNCE